MADAEEITRQVAEALAGFSAEEVEAVLAALIPGTGPAPSKPMSNATAHKGFTLAEVDLVEQMRAFDQLPADVRRAVSAAFVKWDAAQILEELRAGRMTQVEVIRDLAFRNRKLLETTHVG